MKIDNKTIIIISVSALVLVSFYAYSVRSSISYAVTGDIILRDQRYLGQEFGDINYETFSNVINLPSSSCTGTVNYCAVVYKDSSASTKADINGDGKVDSTDGEILSKAYGCKSGQTCWTQPIEECYFTISGRQFGDPTRDCKFDSSDQALITANMGKTHTNMGKQACGSDPICEADINQDGTVDIMDAIIASNLMNKNADTFVRIANSKSQADINGNGEVDILDAITMSNSYGRAAVEQTCFNTPLVHTSGNQYGVNIPTIKSPYYISVTYTCS